MAPRSPNSRKATKLFFLPPVGLGGDMTFRGFAGEIDLFGERLADIIVFADADDRVGGAVAFGDDRGSDGFGHGEGFFEVFSELVDGEEGFRVDGKGGF